MVRMSREDVVQVGASIVFSNHKKKHLFTRVFFFTELQLNCLPLSLSVVFCMYILHVHTNYCVCSCIVKHGYRADHSWLNLKEIYIELGRLAQSSGWGLTIPRLTCPPFCWLSALLCWFLKGWSNCQRICSWFSCLYASAVHSPIVFFFPPSTVSNYS